MDAFFASCEEALNPALKEKPLIVGGTKEDIRSIVSCPNYLARKKGVRTAMPISKALLLAPEANFIRGTKGLYSDFSKRVMEILKNFCPEVYQASIDEAYIDVSGVIYKYKNNPLELAEKIKNEIKTKLNITCSIGISKGKTISKIASKQNKPDGITYVKNGKEMEFLAPLPVERIPGVGKATFLKMSKYGIKLIGDILKFDKSFFINEIGLHSGYLYDIASGIDNSELHEYHENRKSLSKENTFDSDTDDINFLTAELYSLLEKACNRLRKYSDEAKVLTVKVKYFDFSVNQKSHSYPEYSSNEQDYYEDAKILLSKLMSKKKKIRLLGVRFSELRNNYDMLQENLFLDEDKFKKLNQNLDKIRNKYDFNIIKFGKNFEKRN